MKSKNNSSANVRRLTFLALLSAISSVLMFIEFPLPFMPPFLKFDLSGVPILLAAMMFGWKSAVSVAFVKDIIHCLSTTTGGVGELADFLIMSSFAIVVALIYKKFSKEKGLILASVCGTLTCALVGAAANLYLLIPFFSKVMPMDAIFAACSAVNPLIDGLDAYIIFGAVPFNLIKGCLLSVCTVFLFKRLGKFSDLFM